MSGDSPSESSVDKIGLIGLGAFGRLAASCLATHAEVLCYDPELPDDEVKSAGATPAHLEDAADAQAVVLSVPVQAIPAACSAISGMLAENTLVCDVGSVKLRPIEWMLAALPPHVQVLGTHPLFGPQTVEELGGIAGEPIVLCPARMGEETFDKARGFIEEKMCLKPIQMTADEHDQQMAFVQGITHLIGRAASSMRLEDFPTATLAYQKLLQMKANTDQDAPELFDAIQRLNPYAINTRNAFLNAVKEIVDSADAAEPVRNR
ncbi:MAG: prephenate dehydrogenase [Planctomycetota bacterium]